MLWQLLEEKFNRMNCKEMAERPGEWLRLIPEEEYLVMCIIFMRLDSHRKAGREKQE